MDARNSKTKTRAGRKSKKTTVKTGSQPLTATQIGDEIRDELTTLMQELLMKCHELSFEYSTLDCEDIIECPLGKKCKELFKTVKKLNELVRKFAQPRGQPTYIS